MPTDRPTDLRPLLRFGCVYCAIVGAMGLVPGLFIGPAILFAALGHLAAAILLWRFAR